MADAAPSNRAMFEHLIRTGAMDLVRGTVFDCPPPPLPEGFDFHKVEGMMLGLIVGESLGTPTEGWLPRKRKLVHGEIRDYLPSKFGFAPGGLASDDMQLAFRTLERMLEDGGFNPERMALDFSRHHVFGRGLTVRRFIGNYHAGLPWFQCGPRSARNGAMVRIAPMLIPHLREPSAELWIDTALSAMITHNDAGSTAACVALVHMLWRLLGMSAPPKANWWLETFVGTMKELEGQTCYRAKGGRFFGYEGPIWRFVEEKVTEAYRAGISTLEACDQWHSGAFLLETVPSVLYILMCRGTDPEEAIVRAVNDTRDNDTIAAIVGAAMGALYGRDALPAGWIGRLMECAGATEADRVQSLLNAARQRWA